MRDTVAGDLISDSLRDVLGSDEQRSRAAQTPMMFFDTSFHRLIPRELQEVGPSWEDDRMVRRQLWARYGRPMHFLSLEFEDEGVEEEFKKDYTRRNKRWVEYAVVARGLWLFLYVAFRTATDADHHHRRHWKYYSGFTLLSSLIYFLQYLQIFWDRFFVYRQFQHVCFFWCMIHATCINILTSFVAANMYADQCISATPEREIIFRVRNADVELISHFVLLSLIIYRMPFLYFLYVNLYVAFSYFLLQVYQVMQYGVRSPCVPVRLHVCQVALVSIGLGFLSFAMEVFQRKDFVQASMVFKESQRSDMLLYNIFPDVIVERLKDDKSKKAFAESHEGVTVLFADVVSFTNMSAQVTPKVLVELLDSMFLKFDDLAVKNGAEKIKTIGDCYMAAAGLPICSPDHAKTMARFGLQMLELVASGQMRNPATQEPIRVRIGIHSGPCVAGVIGHKKFAYDIWGDTVNTASRMESHGEPMRLHCSSDTYELIKDDFSCEARPQMEVKGKGTLQTYFVLEEKPTAMGKSFVRNAGSMALKNDSFLLAQDGDIGSSNSMTDIPLSVASLGGGIPEDEMLQEDSLTPSNIGRKTWKSAASRIIHEARRVSRSLTSLGFENSDSMTSQASFTPASQARASHTPAHTANVEMSLQGQGNL